jgi:hypothetical protein
MKSILMALVLAAFGAGTCQAGEVRIPSEVPVAAITIPDGWTAKEDDGGLDVSSPSDEVYLGIEIAETKEAAATVEEWKQWIAGEGVKLDPATEKPSQGTIGGRSYSAIDMSGTDKDGPVDVFFAMLDIDPSHKVVMTYWATRDEQAKYLPAVKTMLRSIRPLP